MLKRLWNRLMRNLSARDESKPIISKADVDPEIVARSQNTWEGGGGC
ncbi:MAG: hypothetical protein ACN4GZ_15420 [Acidimicrobiales bacterium]